ncbi:MAG TPA: lantibiotic dehydratase [Thermoanaerobaculia bacterium]|nr:lantibiotic dehydratase [Thermoanaerobaculia bacterium]
MPHLVALPGAEWALWRRAGLRSAGFPAELASRLADPACAAAADEAHAADAALARERRRGRGRPAAAFDRAAAARESYRQAYDEALRRQSQAIEELTSSERCRVAILWQNRGVFHHELTHRAEGGESGPPPGARRRKREKLLANYLQRLTVKNDTIGFFGPMAWASLAADGPAARIRVGPDVIRSQEVYLDSWCFEEIARALTASHPSLRAWLAPLRLPFARVDGELLQLPLRPPIRLDPARAALLAACDGRRLAREIAADLAQDVRLGLRGEPQVFQLLAELAASGLIDWSFRVPVHPRAAEALRRQLERVADPSSRHAALAALEEIETARQAVARARGAETLDRALGDLEGCFSRLTGAAATRNQGMTYGGKTLAYLECSRDLEVELGADVHAAIAEPLALVLQSARWFTFEAARMAREALLGLYRELARAGSPPVDMLQFWVRFQQLDQQLPLAREMRSRLHQRWEELLAVPPGERRARFTCAQLRDRVHQVFSAPGPGWPLARYHNPDVMIAANGAEAIARGDYELVLGELHVAACSLNIWALLLQCPERDEVFANMDADFPQPRVVFLEPRNLDGVTSRTRRAYFRSADVLVTPLEGAVPLPDRQGLSLADMFVRETAGHLEVCTRDGRLRAEILDFLGDLLTVRLTSQFSLLAPRPHTPRITVDRMVVARESWRIPAAQLDFAQRHEGSERFLAVRGWARRLNLPRTVFVQVPVEDKPFYVDFDSPVFVDLFTRAVQHTRRAALDDPEIRLTEMYPDLSKLWLPDAQGRRFTSELRLMAVDLTATPATKLSTAPAHPLSNGS